MNRKGLGHPLKLGHDQSGRDPFSGGVRHQDSLGAVGKGKIVVVVPPDLYGRKHCAADVEAVDVGRACRQQALLHPVGRLELVGEEFFLAVQNFSPPPCADDSPHGADYQNDQEVGGKGDGNHRRGDAQRAVEQQVQDFIADQRTQHPAPQPQHHAGHSQSGRGKLFRMPVQHPGTEIADKGDGNHKQGNRPQAHHHGLQGNGAGQHAGDDVQQNPQQVQGGRNAVGRQHQPPQRRGAGPFAQRLPQQGTAAYRPGKRVESASRYGFGIVQQNGFAFFRPSTRFYLSNFPTVKGTGKCGPTVRPKVNRFRPFVIHHSAFIISRDPTLPHIPAPGPAS